MSDIEIRDDRQAGRLEALGSGGGEVVGHIQYFVLESPARALVPVHTIVEPAHEGQGIAGSLARELYTIAAREGITVAPLCPYVVKWAERHPDEAPAADPELLRAARGGWWPTPRASERAGPKAAITPASRTAPRRAASRRAVPYVETPSPHPEPPRAHPRGPRPSRGWVTGGRAHGYAGSSPEPTSTDWLEDPMTNPYPDPVPPGPTPGPGPVPTPPGPTPEPPSPPDPDPTPGPGPVPDPPPSPVPPGPEPVPNPEPGPPLS